MVDISTTCRMIEIHLDGKRLYLRELNGKDLMHVWQELTKAEQTGDMSEAYLHVVSRGVVDDKGLRVYPKISEVGELPGRVLVDLGERVLRLSEIDLDIDENPTERPALSPVTSPSRSGDGTSRTG